MCVGQETDDPSLRHELMSLDPQCFASHLHLFLAQAEYLRIRTVLKPRHPESASKEFA